MPATPRPTARRRRPSSPAPIRTSRACWKASSPPIRRSIRSSRTPGSSACAAGCRGIAMSASSGAPACSAPSTATTSIRSPTRSPAAATSTTSATRCGRASKSVAGTRTTRWMVYANYAFVHATFQSSLHHALARTILVAFECEDGPGSPPSDEEPNCVQVNAGDTNPGRSAQPLQDGLRLPDHAAVEIRRRPRRRLEPVLLSATKATTTRRWAATPRSTCTRSTT